MNAPANAPLPIGWNYASTSYFPVQDPDAFRAFLATQNVYFNCRDDEFMLLAHETDYWPGAINDDFLFLGLDDDASDDGDGLPYAERRDLFWREVRSHLMPDTHLIIMDVGFFGYAPFLFGRQMSHGARATLMHQDGRMISLELEDLIESTLLAQGW
ncbi:hypothetical protein ILT44_21085 [Microvirga sp. BT689]|uniref:hypothetical protein n=1 Tax=Microvirga arvi TaxID=2778731 RepID=UPI001950A157|nr:hypothetical protein [Microvirga arvi]MBM6582703.1 hypothetical protein [Microvirga arvi]